MQSKNRVASGGWPSFRAGMGAVKLHEVVTIDATWRLPESAEDDETATATPGLSEVRSMEI